MTALWASEFKIRIVWIGPKGHKSGFKSERSEKSRVGMFVTSNFVGIDVGGKISMLEVHKPEELSPVVVNKSGVIDSLSEPVKPDSSRESSTAARSPPSRKPEQIWRLGVMWRKRYSSIHTSRTLDNSPRHIDGVFPKQKACKISAKSRRASYLISVPDKPSIADFASS
jgi:hypothetical protein